MINSNTVRLLGDDQIFALDETSQLFIPTVSKAYTSYIKAISLLFVSVGGAGSFMAAGIWYLPKYAEMLYNSDIGDYFNRNYDFILSKKVLLNCTDASYTYWNCFNDSVLLSDDCFPDSSTMLQLPGCDEPLKIGNDTRFGADLFLPAFYLSFVLLMLASVSWGMLRYSSSQEELSCLRKTATVSFILFSAIFLIALSYVLPAIDTGELDLCASLCRTVLLGNGTVVHGEAMSKWVGQGEGANFRNTFYLFGLVIGAVLTVASVPLAIRNFSQAKEQYRQARVRSSSNALMMNSVFNALDNNESDGNSVTPLTLQNSG